MLVGTLNGRTGNEVTRRCDSGQIQMAHQDVLENACCWKCDAVVFVCVSRVWDRIKHVENQQMGRSIYRIEFLELFLISLWHCRALFELCLYIVIIIKILYTLICYEFHKIYKNDENICFKEIFYKLDYSFYLYIR